MTTTATIRIAYANDRHSSGSLILRQEEWGKIGKTTKLDLVKALEAQIFGGDVLPIGCGLDEDGTSYTCTVYAYPRPNNLAFNIGITNGTISGAIRQAVLVRETVSFSLSDSASLSLPADSLVGLEWNSQELWNEYGEAVPPPSISHDDGVITAGSKVYGDAVATYWTTRLTYTVRVPVREESVENVFASTVYAWWDGGIELLTLSDPPNAEKNYTGKTNCFGGSSLGIGDDDDPQGPPVAPSGGEEVINLNYCEDFGHLPEYNL
jgi:hypothetical protein